MRAQSLQSVSPFLKPPVFSGLKNQRAPISAPSADVFVRFGGEKPAQKFRKTIAIVPQTHWDREWYEPFATFAMRQRDVMGDVTKRLESGELPAFSFDAQIRAYQDYMNSLNREIESLERGKGDAALLKALKTERKNSLQQVRDGRLSIGPWYIQPDLFLPSGESMIRNLKRGIQLARTQYKVPDFNIGYLPDPFGQPASMPMLLSGFGIDNMIFWRGGRAENTDSYWLGADGSKILTRQFKGDWGYSTREPLLDELTPAQKEAAAVKLVNSTKALSPVTDLVLFPVGGDHMGAIQTENLGFLTDALKRRYPDYDVRVMTYPTFMDEVRGRVAGHEEELEEISGHQLKNHGQGSGNILQGVYSARMDVKQANRKLESNLAHAEFTTALNRMLVSQKPDHIARGQLDEAEEMLLLNQPHDSICGCSDDMVHRENLVRNDIGMTKTQDVRENQLAAIGETLATPNQWVVVNNSGRPYTGPVKVKEWQKPKLNYFSITQRGSNFDMVASDYMHYSPSATTQLTHEEMGFENENDRRRTTNPDNVLYDLYRDGYIWVENIPAFGFKVIDKKTKPAFTPVKYDSGKLSMDNGLLGVRVNLDGTVNVTDHNTGKTHERMHLITDTDEQGDSYNSAPVPGSQRRTARVVSGPRLVEYGPLRTTYEVKLSLGRSKNDQMPITTRITLEAGKPQIQFETSYTNTFKDHKLQVNFPTEAPIDEVRAEGHFGIESREFDPDYDVLDPKHYPARDPQRGGHMRELPVNSGAIQRFVLANDQMFLTEGMTEYEVAKDTMKLTLLRAFGYLSLPNTGVRDDAAGPHMATPEGQMLNKPLTLRYAWQPAPETDADAYHTADMFYGAVSGEQGRNENASGKPQSQGLVAWHNDAVRASTVRESDNGKGLLVRLVNTTDKAQTITLDAGFDFSRLQRLDFSERVKATLKKDSAITLKPYAVETLLLAC